MKSPDPGRMGATWRAILISLILIPPNCYWIAQVEGVWDKGHSTCMSLMWGVVFNLIILILINKFVLKRFFPKQILTQGELVTVYIMLSLASGVAGRDMLQILMPALGWPFWFATPENGWAYLFHKYLPRWLMVDDQTSLRYFFEGGVGLYRRWEYILPWLGPAFWWTLFITSLGFTMLCINVMVRKQWAHRERLTYPIIQLPLAITENGGEARIFRSRRFWTGFICAGVLDIINGLHYLYPFIPHIPVSYLENQFGYLFTTPPWNAIGSFPFPLYPFAISIGFLLPLDLSFSCWFFYLFRKGQQVLSAALGLQALPNFPYLNQQSTGAWIGLFLVAIWLSRGHLRDVIRKALGRAPSVDDSEEPMGYRAAILGFLAGFSFLLLFSWRAGMSLAIGIPYFLLFFVFSTSITRMRAELGPPTHEIVNMNSGNMLVDILGTKRIGPSSLTIFPLYWFFSGRGYRGHLMPHQLEGLKMAEQIGMGNRNLIPAMLLGIAFGTISSFWAYLHVSYDVGMASMRIGHSGQWGVLASRLNNPTGTDWPAVIFTGTGFAFTLFLMFMRTRFLWWPFHPAGYALSMNFGIDYIWSCFLISSLIKWIVLRYSGFKTYRATIPLAFGVILGEFCVGGAWTLLGLVLNKPMYDFYHG